MSVLRSMILAFSMFSRIPVPKVGWNDKNMRYMMAFFPLVGTAVGLLLLGWGELAASAGMGRMLFACGLTVIPIAVTGGIHLDGFCDTADALASRAAPERKREILKDPHIGSFAAISVCCYLLIYFSLCCEFAISRGSLVMLLCIHTLSRAISAVSLIVLPADVHKGTAAAFAEASDKPIVLTALVAAMLCCGLTAIAISPPGGVLIVLNGALCFLLLKRMARRDFEGMRGDLVGFFLQVNELLSIACVIMAQKGGSM